MSFKEGKAVDDSPEEEEIKKVLESYPLRKPPVSLMRNYEEEVLKKIHTPAGPALGATALFSISAAFVLIALLALVFWLGPRGAKNKAQISPPATDSMTVEKIKEGGDEILFRQMADDLLILEMLGEEEGLRDPFERLETDMEWLAPVNTPL